MLGFGAYSELAFAQATASATALIAITAVASQGYAGTLDYDAQASTIFSSAAATGYVALEFDAQAATEVVGVLSSMSINDLLDVDAQATITPSAVTASFSLDIDYDAKAFVTVGSTSAATTVNDLADADAQATANLSTTAAYLSIFITDVDAYKIGKAFMFPVGASTAANAPDYDAKANIVSTSVSSNTAISTIDFDAEANITTSSVSLSGVVEEPAYIWGTAKVYPQSLVARIRYNLDAPLPNNFPYEDHIDDYNPSRVLYVSAYVDAGTSTVYIQEENNTLFIAPYSDVAETVFIAAEDYTVVVQPYVDSTKTIFIDR